MVQKRKSVLQDFGSSLMQGLGAFSPPPATNVSMGNAQARQSALPTAAARHTTNPNGAQTAAGIAASVMPYGGMENVSPMRGHQGLLNEQQKMLMVDRNSGQRMEQIGEMQRYLSAKTDAAAQNQYSRMTSPQDIAMPSPAEMAQSYRSSALQAYRSGAGGAIGAGMERRFAPASSLAPPPGTIPLQVGGYGSPVQHIPVGNGQQTMDRFRESALANKDNRNFEGPYVSKSGGLTSRRNWLEQNGRQEDADVISAQNETKWDAQEARQRAFREARGGFSDYQLRQQKRGREFAGPQNQMQDANPVDQNPVRRRNGGSALDNRGGGFTMPGGMPDPVTQRKSEEKINRLTSPDTEFNTATPTGREEYAQASMLQSLGLNIQSDPGTMFSSIRQSFTNPEFSKKIQEDPATRKAFSTAIQTYVAGMKNRSQKWQSGMPEEQKRLIDTIAKSNPADEREQKNIINLFMQDFMSWQNSAADANRQQQQYGQPIGF